MSVNRLREHFAGGGAAVGGWCTTASPLAAEILAAEGLDYVCVDTQHGVIGYDAMVPMLHALSAYPATPVVRVPWNEPGTIGKTLDAGAEVLIVPMVNSREDAERAVRAARYHPEGHRSFGPVRSGLWLGADTEAVNRQVMVFPMIETVQAVERAEEICTTPGVDGIYVGPADLAVTMGMPVGAMAESREHADALDVVRRTCDAAGIVPGIHTPGGAAARGYLDAGFRMVTLATDAALLRAAAARELAVVRGPEPDEDEHTAGIYR